MDDYKDFSELISLLGERPVSAQVLEAHREMKSAHLADVRARLSRMVLTNYDQFVRSIAKIQSMSMFLSETKQLARQTRMMIVGADEAIILNSTEILKKFRRKKKLMKVLDIIEKLTEMQAVEKEVQNCLQNKDYRKVYINIIDTNI
ncbi:MAG: hypothetical protein EZS28_049438 [Streblomastix strix]|uniref:Vacuolar protein sorting-associated protein 54 N-terminal domain-containing protein n=1 Tax=Streblomastix strix TaxID=222440 RepID=A0A5J4T9B1_9EUKA|nr:MAG: hypothetical protein EZS28_049438 [Streblomastix strix]